MPQNPQGKIDDCRLLMGGEKMYFVTEKELLQNLIQNEKQRKDYP